MDLLLEHQNDEFKRFRVDRGSSLQESDEMFRYITILKMLFKANLEYRLHALSVDTLQRVRRLLNRIIICRERKGCHPQKDSSFDLLSLADQLNRSKSALPDGPKHGKIYFSENEVPDLIKEGMDILPKAMNS